MGIYDREYYQEEEPKGFGFGRSPGGGGTMDMTTRLIIITVVVYLVDELLLSPKDMPSFGTRYLALQGDAFYHPWKLYQLLTHGFMHASMNSNIWHIIFNMFCLFMFGRVVEETLGRVEYVLFYLTGIVAGGLCWLTYETATNANFAICLGASAGVTAVVIYFCLRYPNQSVYLFGVFAMPAWVLGVVLVGMDLLRSLNPNTVVSWQGHLGGAAFAFIYMKSQVRLERLFRVKTLAGMFKSKPQLKVHRPSKDEELQRKADELLQKVHEFGEESLTGRERRLLEQYSRQMRQKRSDS